MRPSATSSASLPDKIDLKPAPEGRFFIDRRTHPDYNASVTFRLDKGDSYEADHFSRAAGLSLRRDRRYFLGLFRHLRSISFLQFSCAAAVAFLYAAVFHRHYSDGSGPAAPPRCLPGHLEGPPARSASGGLRYFRPHGLPVRLYHGYFLFQRRHHNGSANSEPGFYSAYHLRPCPALSHENRDRRAASGAVRNVSAGHRRQARSACHLPCRTSLGPCHSVGRCTVQYAAVKALGAL